MINQINIKYFDILYTSSIKFIDKQLKRYWILRKQDIHNGRLNHNLQI